MSARTVLVSLHDASPRHATAVEGILGFLAELGIPPVPLLVVPDFHGAWPLEDHPGFAGRLRAWHDIGHELVLHGYWHQERSEDIAGSRIGDSLKRRFLTGGEGEFLALDAPAARRRIEMGLDMWNRCGLPDRPRGFIPPAWLHAPDLDLALWALGFTWTENHVGTRLSDGRALANPVISWASRDPLRRLGSRVVCPFLERIWRSRPVVRIALHPHDFDHPALVRSISQVLRRCADNSSWGDLSRLVG